MNYSQKENLGCVSSILGAGIGVFLVCKVFWPEAPVNIKVFASWCGGIFGFVIGSVLVEMLVKESWGSAEMTSNGDDGVGDKSTKTGVRDAGTKRQNDEAIAQQKREKAQAESRAREEHFLRSLFSILAKLAKADGKVDKEEVRTAERVFDRFEFASRRRQFCTGIFNAAKDDSSSIYWYAEQLWNQTSDNEVCIFVYELLWDVACADGWLHPVEKEILRKICDFLHIPKAYYDINYRRRRSTFVEGDKWARRNEAKGTSQQRRAWRRPYVSGKSSILEAYELLESESTASQEELQSAYRRLVKRYHPDLLRANGVPDEMIVAATERMKQVNAAMADIRKVRGFS